jgi:hypothetical protein
MAMATSTSQAAGGGLLSVLPGTAELLAIVALREPSL